MRLASRGRRALRGGVLLLAVLFTPPLRAPDAPAAEARPPDETLRLGERMYREGLLPSGEPMQAFVSDDVPVDGTAFTCVSCHLRSGLGSIEGNVITPPTNGRILYQPREMLIKGFEFVPTVRQYSKALPPRPAYTDRSLAAVMVGGVDPSGRTIDKVMPRYEVDDDDMEVLIRYLKSLSGEFSPGVSADAIRFATVIADDVPPEAVAAMLGPIEYFFTLKNGSSASLRRNPRNSRMAAMMSGEDLTRKRLELARWTLKGPPDSWGRQLEDYNRREPAFALVGGVIGGEWQPVHRFSEEHGIPCLFPVTDFPVTSDTDWYTLYFSKGLYQEGEAAARYLHTLHDLFKDRGILQLAADTRSGRALAEGFSDTWRKLGHGETETVTLPASEPPTSDGLRRLLGDRNPAALLVWAGPEAVPAVESLAPLKSRPEMVFLSSTALGAGMWKLSEPSRSYAYLTYPYRLPKENARFATLVDPILKAKKIPEAYRAVAERSYDASQVLMKALMEMRGEYFRDYLMDVIGMMADMEYPLYERFSFGPGQRYAAKGCFVVRLGKGENPDLIKVTEWVSH